MKNGDITRAAVLAAIKKCDDLGRPEFLKRYGYGPATRYPLIHEGREYDSKAIAGVAYLMLHGTRPSLSGGRPTVEPLTALGFGIGSR